MSIKISPELKAAILELPEKEKDKLLLRLIRKDIILIQQLHFQLVEDQADLEKRREKSLRQVDSELNRIERHMDAYNYYSHRNLLMDLRSISGIVNEHFLITKDKLGELDLRLHILSQTFHHAGSFFEKNTFSNEKLLLYITGRIKNVFNAYDKLHEDLQYDYKDKLNEILNFAYSSRLREQITDLGIPQEV